MKRYYYKTEDGSGWLNLKTPLNNPKYIEITEEEWSEHKSVFEEKEPTEEEKQKNQVIAQINRYKQLLKDTDYIIIKIAESESEEEQTALRNEYADTIIQRKQWRLSINELEEQLNA